MFKRDVKALGDVLRQFIRNEAWEKVTGRVVAQYTAEKFIKNQVLFVKITNPALRQDLSMMRSQLVRRLNESAGGSIISDVRIY